MNASEFPDWNELWQQARKRKSWRPKKKKDWDQRAATFAKRNADSQFAQLFLEQMQPQPHWRVLDVGCGPGTLALPLAPQVNHISAIDFSQAMLQELAKRQQQQGINNISSYHASWDDDWQQLGLQRHHVAIAARSLAVDDLRKALQKLGSWASHKVFIADRVGPGPFDPELFAALGRPFEPGPDYIYTVNILFQLGIQPHINYLEFDQERTYASREEAVAGCSWMLDEVKEGEEPALERYVDDRSTNNPDGTITVRRSKPVKWALIDWDA